MRFFGFGRLCAMLWCCWALQAWAAVDVNQAPADDLMAIKGIGPRTSERILQARAAGPFRDWPDFIRRVAGIGPATAAKLSAQGLTVNGLALPASGAAPPQTPHPPFPTQPSMTVPRPPAATR